MPCDKNMPQRFLTDNELQNARGLIGWQFWVGPIIPTIFYFVSAWFGLSLDMPILWEVIFFVFLGGLAIWWWLSRCREYNRFRRDIDRRVVELAEGTPERVWMSRDGRCFVRLAGHKIRVPNEYYKALRDANAVKIEYLPESCFAARVKILHGLGIAGR